jgi:hypothetical protein
MHKNKRGIADILTAALCVGGLMSVSAFADDTPSPCAALKRIVAAAPAGFSGLSPEDGKAAALPYGADVTCTPSRASYACSWTASADALEGVAADIASCLPDATHDQNSPSRQHFYLGTRGQRTEIAASTAGADKLKLVISGNK